MLAELLCEGVYVKTRQKCRLFHIDQATIPTYVQSTALVSLT
jgi:hypothetical protein